MPLSLNSPPFTRAVLLRSTLKDVPTALGDLTSVSSIWRELVSIVLDEDSLGKIHLTVLGLRNSTNLFLRPMQSQYMGEGFSAPRTILKYLKTAGDVEWRITPLGSRRTPKETIRKLRFTRVPVSVLPPPVGSELSALTALRSLFLSNRTLLS